MSNTQVTLMSRKRHAKNRDNTVTRRDTPPRARSRAPLTRPVPVKRKKRGRLLQHTRTRL